MFMPWNSYPKFVRNSIKKRLQEKKAIQKDDKSQLKI